MQKQSPITQIDSDSSQLVLCVCFPQFSPRALFDHFTVPELLTHWWPQKAATEPRAGGSYRLSWPAMDWALYGEYTQFLPGERLSFTWRWEHEQDMPARLVEIVFEPEGDGSRLRLTHGTYNKNERDQEERQSHLDGWMHFLGQLLALK